MDKDSILITTRDEFKNKIATTQQNAIKEITEATTLVHVTSTSSINSIQDVKMNATLDINSENESIIQQLNDFHDSVLTDIAVFQNNLNNNTSAKMVNEMKQLHSKLQSDIYRHVLDHSLNIQTDIADIKQEIEIKLLEDKKIEKIRIKNELITEIRTSHAHTNITHATVHSNKATPQYGANNTTMHGYATMQEYITTQNAAYEEYDVMTREPTPDTPDLHVTGPEFDSTGPFNTTMAPGHPHTSSD